MTTRMQHPQHGFTHAYNQSEISYLETRGWTPEVKAAPVAPAAPVVVVEEAPQKKKPGRPHKGS